MRISDWSSDVCSSDLLLIVAIWDAAVLSSRVTAGELTFSSFDPHVAMAGSEATGLIFAVSCFSGFEATAIFRDEAIGRASCRERVCQYVCISVVAVSLKKTTL